MSGVHKHPTISFRVSDREREMIEAKIFASGMQAKQMLRELAETTNMVQSNEVFEMADEQGISKRTLENAKKELDIQAKKINNSWYWELDAVEQR